MTIREQIITLFENSKGEYLSGADIAGKLSVTRAAVWKTVRSLLDEGYQIDAVTNRGYRLLESTDVLSTAGIRKYLNPEVRDLEIEVFKSATSTNLVLREKANAGAKEGTVVVAKQQTGGRGRLGRSFYSPSDTGIYMSLLLRPQLETDAATHITTLAAVAICAAIEKVSDKKPQIKWVNDVFIGDKKVCGILTEASFDMESGKIEYAILGAGVNIYAPPDGFPDEIKNVAGNVLDSMQNDARNRLVAEILNSFMRLYDTMGSGDYIEKYRQRSLAIGRRITVLSGGKGTPATAHDIDNNCRLLVRYDDGSEAALSSGEISIKL